MGAPSRIPIPPKSENELDPGLANERTALAWNRSALSLAALAALAVRTGFKTKRPEVADPLAGLLMLVATGTWLYGKHAYGRNQTARQTGLAWQRPVALATIAATTALSAILAFALALVS